MATEEVQLLGFWASPFVYRVQWALKLKGVEFEYIEEDIFNKSSRLLALNPVRKMVPVFIHDHKAISESLVILEYIDETWAQNPLLPLDPYQRAMARFWARFVEEKLLPATWRAMWSRGEQKETAEKQMREALEKLEERLKGKDHFGEDGTIGYLDLAIGWIAYWLPVWEEVGSMNNLDLEKYPGINAWMSRFLDHPVIKDNSPPRDRMLEFYHKRSRDIYNKYGSSKR